MSGINTNMNFKEAVNQYENYVENRIKNGPPKFQIGKEEYTTEQWKRLFTSTDPEVGDIFDFEKKLKEKIDNEEQY